MERGELSPTNAACVDVGKTAVFFVNGNIGAGKTTLLNALREEKNVVCVEEAVDEWQQTGLLTKAYEDPTKYVFALQMMTLLTMVDRISKAVKCGEGHTIVVERSPEVNRNVFKRLAVENGDIDGSMEPVYERMYGLLVEPLLRDVSITNVYIRMPVEECEARVKRRGRPGEEYITPQYLRRLHALHEELFDGREDVVVVNNNTDADITAIVHTITKKSLPKP
jgi:deoxyguanosine kinase